MVVAVVGMHRSGTSMVAALLYRAGIYLGPEDDLMSATPDNQDGFWENLRFVDLDDALLSALGGGWDEPPPNVVTQTPGVAAERVRAEALVREFETRQPWGWKDPRTTLLLPFWLEVIPDLRLVGCVRNPLEVALSLNRRNYFSYERGLSLWLDYNERMLETAPAEQLLLTHYEAYFADPAAELRRVLAHCGLEAPDERVDEACASARDVLRHNRFTLADLLAAEVSREVIELYSRLCELCNWSGQEATSELAARLHPGDTGPRGKINRSVIDARVLRNQVNGLQGTLHLRESELEQLRAHAEELRVALVEQTEATERTTAVLAEREETIEELRARVAALQEQLGAERALHEDGAPEAGDPVIEPWQSGA